VNKKGERDRERKGEGGMEYVITWSELTFYKNGKVYSMQYTQFQDSTP
jgi:hypothetical protein